MPNERTPLELAREIQKYDADVHDFAPSEIKAIAAALIERETPVEVEQLEDSQSGFVKCCHLPAWRGYKFCPGCGRPITWK